MATTLKRRVPTRHVWTFTDIFYPDGKTFEYEDSDEAQAVWSRPRPPRLTFTAMSVDRYRYNPEGFTDYYGYRTGSAPAFHRASSSRGKTNPWPTDATIGIAQQRAGAKFRGPDLDLGEGLTGLRSSYRMIAARVGSLVSFLSNVRKYGARNAIAATGLNWPTDGVSNTKRMSDAYLETTFGWGQMASDAYGAASAIERGLSGNGTFVSARATEYTTKHPLGSRGFAKVTLGGTIYHPGLRALNQLGLNNPALIAWQNVPLSFVADWFIGLSDALAYMTWGAGLHNKAMCITKARVGLQERQRPSGKWVVWREYTDIRRTVHYPDFIWAGLMADRQISVDVGKALTSSALIAQRLFR